MKKDFLEGIKAGIPISIGILPVGISISILAVQVGFSKLEAVLMSALVFGGSSQLMAISMINMGAALSTIIIGTFFINLRHIIMSSYIMRTLEKTSLGKRLLVSFWICDESFAVYSLSDNNSYDFLLGLNTILYIIYMGSIILGAIVTSFLPEIIINSFGIAFYAALLGLLVPSLKGEKKIVILVIITGIINFLLGKIIPSSWGIILSMIIGAFIGVYFVEDKTLDIKIKEEENEL